MEREGNFIPRLKKEMVHFSSSMKVEIISLFLWCFQTWWWFMLFIGEYSEFGEEKLIVLIVFFFVLITNLKLSKKL